MNNGKQNLLPSKYLVNYYVETFVKVMVYFALGVIIFFLIILGYSKYLEHNVEELQTKLQGINVNKNTYLAKQSTLNERLMILDDTNQKLESIKALNGDYSDFDIFLSYIVNTKPYDVTIISLEDLTIIKDGKGYDSGSSGETNSDGNVISGAEIQGTIETSTESGEITTIQTSPESVYVESGNQDYSNNWNPNKFDNSLIYSHDIGDCYVLIRGYSTNINSLAIYVDSIADAPEIQGYTIEGIEDKITHIDDTNVILFELKLKMEGAN